MRVAHFLKTAATDPLLASGYLSILSQVAVRRIRHKLFSSPQKFKQPINCFGYPLVLDLREQMQSFMARQIYSPLVEFALRDLIKGKKVFFDVGAHVGYFSAMACRILPEGGRVIAFEPNPDRLPSLTTLQTAASDRFSFFPLGLSDKDLVLSFQRDTYNTGMSRISSSAGENKEQVHVRPLDKLMSEHSLPGPDVIKVDIEGHEMAFLRGARQTLERYHPSIVCEISEKKERTYSFAEFAKFIADLRYRILPLDHLGRKEISLDQLELALESGNVDAILKPQYSLTF